MMVIVMEPSAPMEQVSGVLRRLEEGGVMPHMSREGNRVSIGVTAVLPIPEQEALRSMSGVSDVSGVRQPFKLASREFRPDDSIVKVGNVEIGGLRDYRDAVKKYEEKKAVALLLKRGEQTLYVGLKPQE